jgi:hypothetical protein
MLLTYTHLDKYILCLFIRCVHAEIYVVRVGLVAESDFDGKFSIV